MISMKNKDQITSTFDGFQSLMVKPSPPKKDSSDSENEERDESDHESDRIKISPLPAQCTKLDVLQFVTPSVTTPILAIRFMELSQTQQQTAIIVLDNEHEATKCVRNLDGHCLCGHKVTVEKYTGNYLEHFGRERIQQNSQNHQNNTYQYRMEEIKRKRAEKGLGLKAVMKRKRVKEQIKSIKKKIKVAAKRVEKFKDRSHRGIPTEMRLEIQRMEALIKSSLPAEGDMKALKARNKDYKESVKQKKKYGEEMMKKAKEMKKQRDEINRRNRIRKKQGDRTSSQYHQYKRAMNARKPKPYQCWPEEKRAKKGRQRKWRQEKVNR